MHASQLTGLDDIKNSEIRIEKDYLKHFKNKCGMALTRFILINKVNGFKYLIMVFSDLSRSSSLYSGLFFLSTIVISVVAKAKY